MDYTYIRELIKVRLVADGINPICIDEQYQLYYDETNNIKKFYINEESSLTNVSADTIFVLGGLEGSGHISLNELKELFRLQDNIKEIKSKHIYNGSFTDCLKSDRLQTYLDLLDSKAWHIHFQSLNLMYWSIVDILDSIVDFRKQAPESSNLLKALLYRVVKANLNLIIRLMIKYNYPDIKGKDDLLSFFMELYALTSEYEIGGSLELNYLKDELLRYLEAGSKQKEAIFIQNEQRLRLLDTLSCFYFQELYIWKNSNLIMDNESDIITDLDNMVISIDGEQINNYVFVDSKDNTMVQLSDVAVGIVSKYLLFIDKEGTNLPNVVEKSFNEKQLRNFITLNKILQNSRIYNPVFFNQVTSFEYHSLLNKYIDLYAVK